MADHLTLAGRASACLLAASLSLAIAASAHASSIFFLRNSNIWVANPDGSGAKQVTTDGAPDYASAYSFVNASKSPTNELIAFQRGDQLGVMAPDGSAVSYVTAPLGVSATGPGIAIDPSGSELAYQAPTGFGNFGGATGADGSGNDEFALYQARVIDVGFADAQGTQGLWAGFLLGAPGNNDKPNCDGVDGSSHFGVAYQQLQPEGLPPDTEYPTLGWFCVPGQDVTEPAGSPDGTKVLAVVSTDSGVSRVIEVDKSAMATLSTAQPVSYTYETPDGLDASYPDWSADGSQIAFQGPNDTIYTEPYGSGQPRLILSDASVPAWSPYTLPSGGSDNGSGSGGSGGSGSGGSGGSGGTGGSSGGSGGTGSAHQHRTGVRITAHPPHRVKTRRRTARVTFRFSATGHASGFRCKVGGARFAPCRSPKHYRLETGQHTFEVEAIGPGGIRSRPARFAFRITRRR